MYFHGPAKALKGQWSGVAISTNGLDFKASQEILGKFYFRVWRWNGYWYALAKNNNEGWGELYKSRDGLSGFQCRGNFLAGMRHAAVMKQGHHLLIFYSRVGANPERILVTSVDMLSDWMNWIPSAPKEIIKPDTDYEGIEYSLEPSEHGASCKVRDPCVVENKGMTFLFYTVAGEMGIAGACLYMHEIPL